MRIIILTLFLLFLFSMGSYAYVQQATSEIVKQAQKAQPTPVREVQAIADTEPKAVNGLGNMNGLTEATPTPEPILPTNTPIPTIIIVPTSNPNKDSICRNEAELKKIQLKEQLAQIAASKAPPGTDWSLIMQGIENEAQKAYYQIYNICLTR